MAVHLFIQQMILEVQAPHKTYAQQTKRLEGETESK